MQSLQITIPLLHEPTTHQQELCYRHSCNNQISLGRKGGGEFSLTYIQVVGERFWCIFEASWHRGGILPFQCLSCKPSLFQRLDGPTHMVQWYPGVEGTMSIKTVHNKSINNYSVDSAYYKHNS